uniref:CSON008553 protein n=1 Tax=Culicoides sonorensis TaxID=179676 RepID=A0A336N205_CULSO
MKFLWIFTVIFSMVVLVLGHHQTCPLPFAKDGNECITGRPVKGECPPNSTYKVATNKCHLNFNH